MALTDTQKKAKRFIITGGGIAGLTAAIALARKGINATVYEAAPSLKQAGAGLGLAANAIKAFCSIGIADDVIAEGHFLPAFTIYDAKGKQITRTDTEAVGKKYGQDNFAIHRAALHKVLLSKITPDQLHLGRRLIRVEQRTASCILQFEDGTCGEADYLIVADGIHSPVRRQLLPGIKERYSGYTCWRAVVDNTFGSIHEAAEYWSVQGRFGMLPLAGNKIYWYACLNAEPNDPGMKMMTTETLSQQFAHLPHPIPSVIKCTPQSALIWNDIYDLPPVKNYAFNNIVLMGDAAHATTPNMGQGACQAIEDAVVLATEIGKEENTNMAFANYEERRRQRTQDIVHRSRLLGKIAQCENPLLAGVRDTLLRWMPQRMNERQLETLYNIDF